MSPLIAGADIELENVSKVSKCGAATHRFRVRLHCLPILSTPAARMSELAAAPVHGERADGRVHAARACRRRGDLPEPTRRSTQMRLARFPAPIAGRRRALCAPGPQQPVDSMQTALQQLRRHDMLLIGRKSSSSTMTLNIFSLTSAARGAWRGLYYARAESRHRVAETDAGCKRRACRHHDAGHGRLRDDPETGDAGFATLPIIAVTAKAMKGDRFKCIERARPIMWPTRRYRSADFRAACVVSQDRCDMARDVRRRQIVNFPAAANQNTTVSASPQHGRHHSIALLHRMCRERKVSSSMTTSGQRLRSVRC